MKPIVINKPYINALLVMVFQVRIYFAHTVKFCNLIILAACSGSRNPHLFINRSGLYLNISKISTGFSCFHKSFMVIMHWINIVWNYRFCNPPCRCSDQLNASACVRNSVVLGWHWNTWFPVGINYCHIQFV